MSKPVRIGIVGAGISGLATAYYLRQESLRRDLEIQLTLIEKSPRLGGVIRSEKVDGLLLEAGPEGFAPRNPAAQQLIEDLGLSSELIGSKEGCRRLFILENKKLRALPQGMAFLAPVRFGAFWKTAPLSWTGKVRAMLEPCIGKSDDDLSVRRFLERRFGREFTSKVAEPLVTTIYGGEPDRLSAVSTLRELHRLEQRHGSLWKGLRAVFPKRSTPAAPAYLSLRGGMGRLVQRLEEELEGEDVCRGVNGLRLESSRSRAFHLRGAGFEGDFDKLILCTPASASAEILRSSHPRLAGELIGIPYSSSRIVYLLYKRRDFSQPLDGFGFVVPRGEASLLRACTWVSNKFEGRSPSDMILLRCALRGGGFAGGSLAPEEAALTLHRELREILGAEGRPVFFRVFQIREAMPQLLVGHERRLGRISDDLKRHEGLVFNSAFAEGMGIPERILNARRTASAVTESAEGA